jgi:D-sedoheptulose 7-phosphate isomerase
MSDGHQKIIERQLRDSIKVKEDIIKTLVPDIEKAANAIIGCHKRGGKVLLFGNGGSAADAQHIAAELTSKFRIERKSLPAIALNTNTSIITAVGNDYDFSEVFAKQIEGLTVKGDVAIGISTSGKSPNVLKGLAIARELGARTIALTGRAGLKQDVAELVLRMPSDDTPRIQEAHITVGHIICGLVESELYGKK